MTLNGMFAVAATRRQLFATTDSLYAPGAFGAVNEMVGPDLGAQISSRLVLPIHTLLDERPRIGQPITLPRAIGLSCPLTSEVHRLNSMVKNRINGFPAVFPVYEIPKKGEDHA
tara:strand:- start:4744 stop:5085 length:342 start_codon:yes stop_codon:yes gene_type:complete